MTSDSGEEQKGGPPPMTTDTILAALKADERVAKYLDQFSAWSQDQFMRDYARNKEMWWRSGPSWIERNERDDLQWITAAEGHLEVIQQKKLFDAQCLWRAEEVSFPEVEVSFDFMVWSQQVHSCPFIGPVTEEEVDLYIEYLGQEDLDVALDEDYFLDWQHYDEFREGQADEEAGRDLPEWYEYHNSRTGAWTLLQLPDLRGEKEAFYRQLTFEHLREVNRAENEDRERNRDKRPYISFYDREQLEQFIRTLDDRETRSYYQAYRRIHQDEDAQELEATLELLLSAGEPVPIEAHADFRVALERAANRLRRRKIAEFLPFVFEEYNLRRSMGQALPGQSSRVMKQIMQLRKLYSDTIIQGRILNGEPGDLAF